MTTFRQIGGQKVVLTPSSSAAFGAFHPQRQEAKVSEFFVATAMRDFRELPFGGIFPQPEPIVALEFEARRKWLFPDQTQPTQGIRGLQRSSSDRMRSRFLPSEARNKLQVWFTEHLSYPYPSQEELWALIEETALTETQVKNWFLNARRRNRDLINLPHQALEILQDWFINNLAEIEPPAHQVRSLAVRTGLTDTQVLNWLRSAFKQHRARFNISKLALDTIFEWRMRHPGQAKPSETEMVEIARATHFTLDHLTAYFNISGEVTSMWLDDDMPPSTPKIQVQNPSHGLPAGQGQVLSRTLMPLIPSEIQAHPDYKHAMQLSERERGGINMQAMRNTTAHVNVNANVNANVNVNVNAGSGSAQHSEGAGAHPSLSLSHSHEMERIGEMQGKPVATLHHAPPPTITNPFGSNPPTPAVSISQEQVHRLSANLVGSKQQMKASFNSSSSPSSANANANANANAANTTTAVTPSWKVKGEEPTTAAVTETVTNTDTNANANANVKASENK